MKRLPPRRSPVYVLLDSEPVAFAGDPPGSPRACFDLLNAHLGAGGRCLIAFRADGEDILAQRQPAFPARAERVEATSADQATVLAAFAQSHLPTLAELPPTLGQLASECLTQPWTLVRGKLPAVSATLAPIVQVIGPLLNYAGNAEAVPAWRAPLAGAEAALGAHLDALAAAAEAGTPAAVSDVLALDLRPALEHLHTLFAETLLPALETRT